MMDEYFMEDEDGRVLPCDQATWGRDRLVAAKKVVGKDSVGEARVSTVFLGIDHSFLGGGLPVLWETMIFGGEHDQYQERYTSRKDALKGHYEAVRGLQDGDFDD